jgi:hypothetical protein
MVADSFFCLKIDRLSVTIHKHIHCCKNWLSAPADFAVTRLLICQLWPFTQWLGRPLAYRGRHSVICQGSLPDMRQQADFGRFYYDPASNLLAYCAVKAVICQRLPQPLCEVPTLANGLDAKS